MSYGDGSIKEKLKSNGKSYSPKRWSVCVSYTVTTKTVDGKTKKERKRIQKTVRGTKEDAKAVRDEIIASHDEQGNEINAQLLNATSSMETKEDYTTLTEIIESWIDSRKMAGKASLRTINADRNRLKHVEKYLGDTPVSSLTPQIIENTYASIREEKNLSGTSMHHIHAALKRALDKAVDYDIIVKNPCNRVEAPQRNAPNRKALTEKESKRLLEEVVKDMAKECNNLEAKEERRAAREESNQARERNAIRLIHVISYLVAVLIGIATGMRRAEVIALIWLNVDLKAKAIYVCQSMSAENEIKATKTAASMRRIAIDDFTVKVLAFWQWLQAKELLKIGIKCDADSPVCCTDTGTFIRLDNFEHWWGDWRKQHGFENLKFHELRHTQATILLANGTDLKTVQDRLGHANGSITLNWYAHAIPERDHDAAQMFGKAIGGSKIQAPFLLESETVEASVVDAEADEIPEISQMSSKCLPNAA